MKDRENRMFKSILVPLVLLAGPAFADPAVVENVSVSKAGNGYTFNVTILHSDTGWDDYADIWRIKAMDGSVLGVRKLAHPHVNEQPFTRSLSGIKIPNDVKSVVVEAHDTVSGWSSRTLTVKLP